MPQCIHDPRHQDLAVSSKVDPTARDDCPWNLEKLLDCRALCICMVGGQYMPERSRRSLKMPQRSNASGNPGLVGFCDSFGGLGGVAASANDLPIKQPELPSHSELWATPSEGQEVFVRCAGGDRSRAARFLSHAIRFWSRMLARGLVQALPSHAWLALLCIDSGMPVW